MTTFAGRINKLFGTDGGVMLSLYDAFPDDFDPQTSPLIVTIDGLDVPLYCDRFERRGVNGATAAFADFDTERRARELVGKEFRVEVQDEGDDDEFYLEDLVGFEVEATIPGDNVSHSGRITDFYDHEANPLFELEVDGRTVLVPAVEEFIAHIDFDAERIHLVLPEGLLDLE